MDSAIWVAIISGVLTLLGVIITVVYGNKKSAETTKGYKDVTLYRIDQLERKVELHNNAVERLFIVEGKVRELEHTQKDIKKELREIDYE